MPSNRFSTGWERSTDSTFNLWAGEKGWYIKTGSFSHRPSLMKNHGICFLSFRTKCCPKSSVKTRLNYLKEGKYSYTCMYAHACAHAHKHNTVNPSCPCPSGLFPAGILNFTSGQRRLLQAVWLWGWLLDLMDMNSCERVILECPYCDHWIKYNGSSKQYGLIFPRHELSSPII